MCVWDAMKDQLHATMVGMKVGDVPDFSNFMGAVIKKRAWEQHKAYARLYLDPRLRAGRRLFRGLTERHVPATVISYLRDVVKQALSKRRPTGYRYLEQVQSGP